MNCYIEILAVGEPFDFDVDENGRNVFSTNLDVTAVGPNDGMEEDMVRICQSVGVLLILPSEDRANANTFIGSKATFPKEDGPYALFISQPGLGILETHNGDKLERPGLQVLVRGKPFTAARARAFEIFRALDGVRNLEVA